MSSSTIIQLHHIAQHNDRQNLPLLPYKVLRRLQDLGSHMDARALVNSSDLIDPPQQANNNWKNGNNTTKSKALLVVVLSCNSTSIVAGREDDGDDDDDHPADNNHTTNAMVDRYIGVRSNGGSCSLEANHESCDPCMIVSRTVIRTRSQDEILHSWLTDS